MLKNKLNKVRWKVNGLAAKFLPRSMVLIYHRVVDLDSDPQRLCVTPENFEQQMGFLAENYRLITLRELTDDLRNRKIRDRTCVVTIDDGYEDNFLYAKPVLERYGIPATIFVSTGFTGAHYEFWWDELERLILQNKNLPEVLVVDINGSQYRWPLSAEQYTPGWTIQTAQAAAEENRESYTRHEVYAQLCQVLQPLEPEQIQAVLVQLRTLSGDSGTARAEFMPMSREQVQALHKGGLIEIGAHTQSHINLASQSISRQKSEIEGSKRDLEALLGTEIESFSYPFGTLRNYSQLSVKCVKAAGFKNAVSGYSGNVTGLSSAYEIPRRVVRDWDADTFARKLHQYYSGQQ